MGYIIGSISTVLIVVDGIICCWKCGCCNCKNYKKSNLNTSGKDDNTSVGGYSGADYSVGGYSGGGNSFGGNSGGGNSFGGNSVGGNGDGDGCSGGA